MKWARRRHARSRKQLRRMVGLFVQAKTDKNFVERTSAPKLVPLRRFCEDIIRGRIDRKLIPTDVLRGADALGKKLGVEVP